MTSNPTPVVKPTRPALQAARNMPVKRDINLISTREAQEKIARRGLFIIAGIVFLLGFAYFAFYLPLTAGNVMESTLQGINMQAEAFSTTDAQYDELYGQVKSLRAISESLKASATGSKSGYDYLKMIESACPSTVRLTQFNLSTTDITLSGVAASDNDVAQLVVNLQSYSDFDHVMLASVTQAVAASSEPAATTPPAGSFVGRAFIVVASFPVAAADGSAAPPEATASPAGNGGSGT